MRAHPDISLVIVLRLAATCTFLAVYCQPILALFMVDRTMLLQNNVV